MMVTALPDHRTTMCVYFESSHRYRTRSTYIARRWKSYSPLDLRGLPYTTDSRDTDHPERAQLPETRCRA